MKLMLVATPTKAFIPAAHFHALTPLYEALVRPFMGRMWWRIAGEVARRAPQGGSVADLGCGPGSILRRIRRLRPDIALMGTDIDPMMIRIAERRAQGQQITFAIASIEKQPVPDQSVDLAMSTLMFHHLQPETKRAAIREVRRILKPEGIFLLCDFSKPSEKHWFLSLEFWRHIEPEIIPQLEGQLLEIAREAGASIETLWTVYGCIALHRLTFPLAP